MKSIIEGYPLWSFFCMAFAFSWTAVLPLSLNRALSLEPFQISGALAGPTLAAVLVIAATEGGSGLAAFFKRYLQWRVGIAWWLIVLFGVLLTLTLGAALLLYCIAFSICATWIYNHTGGSILLQILFHSSSNAAISVGARVLPADLAPQMSVFVFGGWIPALVGIVAAIVVLAITKGSLGYPDAAKDAPASESTAPGWA